MATVYLPERAMQPYVRRAYTFDTEVIGVRECTLPRTAICYELSFYLSGSGSFVCCGEEQPIQHALVRFTRPGETVQGFAPYRAYNIFFDLGEPGVSCSNPVLDIFPHFFTTAGNQQSVFEHIMELHFSERPGNTCLQSALLLQLLSSYYFVLEGRRHRHPAVQKSMFYMQTHYSQKITLEDLGRETSYSPLHLLRVFKAENRVTPNEFLRDIRLTHAKKLLAETGMSVADIARECGFSSEAYFYSTFRSVTGKTPKQYRSASVT